MSLNKCEETVMGLPDRPEDINRVSYRIITGLLALLVLLSVTGCSLFSISAPDIEADPDVPLQVDVLPSVSDDRFLGQDEIVRYADFLRESDYDFSKLRPGGTVGLDGLEEAVIERVVDGDTLILKLNGNKKRVRLIGIDAPESFSHHDESKQTIAGENVSRIVSELLVKDSRVWLMYDQEKYDQYDRILAYVFLDEDLMLNELLARFGLVEVRRYHPNLYFHDYLKSLEADAKTDAIGLW